jgi:transposase-like protein
MSKSVLSAKHFHDEAAAYAFVEARVWPKGPICPHCGGVTRISKMQGESTRIGSYKCYQCRKKFTVKVGTIFESSHIELKVWLQAMYLMSSSKKGISTQQLHRTLGVTLKTAWFMSHRIREAMSDGGAVLPPMGGEGGIVEADETYYGYKLGAKVKRGMKHKHAIVSLVERGGQVRSFHVRNVNAVTVGPILARNIAQDTHLMTDDAGFYKAIKHDFTTHSTVNHRAGEYSRGEITTNTVEGYFSVLKRGLAGVYQHVSEHHLKRYLYEFDFRHSNRIATGCDDTTRTDRMVAGIVGKRLTYQTTRRRIGATA